MEAGGNRKGRVRRSRNDQMDVRAEKVNEGNRQLKEKFAEERQAVKPIQAKNDFQKQVLKALATKQVVVISSPAGSGKSLLAMAHASDMLMKHQCHKIFLARPSVGMGNSLGMLKGDLRQKYEPFLMPLVEVLVQRYGKGVYESGLNTGTIELIPFEYLRGRNLYGVSIVDEVQCATAEELYSVLTRLTEDGQLILLGDRTQSDLKGQDGMTWLHNFVNRHNLHHKVEFIEGTSDDIVRSDFVKSIVKAKEQDTGLYTNQWEVKENNNAR